MKLRSLLATAVASGLVLLTSTIDAARPPRPSGESPRGVQAAAGSAKRTYEDIKAFALTGGSVDVSDLKLKRDRVDMTFTGTFHFAAPVEGRTVGAVFVGQGTFRAEPPAGDAFERDNVRRMIGADVVESDFKTAVLRFTDETAKAIEGARREPAVPASVQKQASEFEVAFTRESGINMAARLAQSVLDAETPGVFFAQFDGGKRNRFNYVLDPQTRIPVDSFDLNYGETGIIFSFQQAFYLEEVWMAFRPLSGYEPGAKPMFSDNNDLVDITSYKLDLDLRQLDKRMGMTAGMEMKARVGNLRLVPFKIGENLSGADNERLEKQLRVKAARVAGQPAEFVQEDWAGSFVVMLPKAAAAGETISIEVDLDGNFMSQAKVMEFTGTGFRETVFPECFFPLSNETWYPRHGYLDRATYDLTFRHRKRERVAAVGLRTSEQPDPEDKNVVITKYSMTEPIGLAVFAVGPYERKTQKTTFEVGGATIPLEFNSMPSRVTYVKDDFILAELDNAVRYFAATFGKYPYASYGAAFHPKAFGQGFPSLLMIPPTDRADKSTYSFMAHEASHQWWGNIVSWRSYRDQWLSEGFAEYSGVLYTQLRDLQNPKASGELIRDMRESLRATPQTALGMGKGRLNDIGPLSMGQRLNTTQTLGAYQALVYNKGALVLRMLHYLMSNPQVEPVATPGQPFFAMMADFVQQHRNGSASTDEFQVVASQHFARTPIAQKFGSSNLDWFFKQWVYGTELPSYTLEYEVKEQPDKSFVLSGTILQENVGKDWQMPLPIVMTFEGNGVARTTVRAQGPSSTFDLKLPARPKKVELDPASWILSDKTTTRAR